MHPTPTDQRRRLSSRATPFYKFGVLGLVGFVWVLSSAVVFAERLPHGLTAVEFAFPLIGVVLFGLIYLVVGRAKHVELAGGAFVVSSRNRSVTIPVHEVAAVGGSRFTNPERVWLDLRRPCEFGSRIHFIPQQRFFHFYSLPPLVAELQDLIAHGGGEGARSSRHE